MITMPDAEPNPYAPDVKPSLGSILHEEFSTNVKYGALTDYLKTKMTDLDTSAQNFLNREFPSLVDKPKILTPDEYKSSEYVRPGINYTKPVPEAQAKSDAAEYDKKSDLAQLEDLGSQSTWAKIAEGTAGMIGSIANPGNLALGVAAGVVAAPLSIGLSAAIGGTGLLTSGITGFLVSQATKTAMSGAVGGVYGFGEGIAHQLEEQRKSGEDFNWRKVWSEAGHDASMFALIDTALIRPLSFAGKALLGKSLSKLSSIRKSPISRDNYKTTIDTAVNQIDNDTAVNIDPLVRQGMFNQRSILDNDMLPKIKANKEIITDGLGKISTEADRLKSLPQTEETAKELDALNQDKILLESKLNDHEMLQSLIENPQEPVSPDDVKTYVDKINSPKSDALTGNLPERPATETELPPLAEDTGYSQRVNAEYNAAKETMTPEARDMAETKIDTTDLDTEKKYHQDMQDCLQRNIGRF